MKTLNAAKREAGARNHGTQKLNDGRIWVVKEVMGNWKVVAVWPNAN